MHISAHLGRAVGLACVLLVALAVVAPPARADTVPTVTPGIHNRFIGEVATVLGTPATPTMFTLQLGDLSIDLRVAPKTNFRALSAEAQVEGFVQGDYALVTAQRVKHDWVATRVVFDVQPVRPLREFDGAVVRESTDDSRCALRITDTGKVAFLRISKDVRYRVDGKLSDIPVTLVKGQMVQTIALQRNGWIAYEINVRTNPPPTGISSYRQGG